MTRYRKKPIVIEAVQYTVETCRDVHAFLGYDHDESDALCDNGIEIDTLEGTMLAEVGDWVIKGIKGEFYPCKPDIFEATYEAVEQ